LKKIRNGKYRRIVKVDLNTYPGGKITIYFASGFGIAGPYSSTRIFRRCWDFTGQNGSGEGRKVIYYVPTCPPNTVPGNDGCDGFTTPFLLVKKTYARKPIERNRMKYNTHTAASSVVDDVQNETGQGLYRIGRTIDTDLIAKQP